MHTAIIAANVWIKAVIAIARSMYQRIAERRDLNTLQILWWREEGRMER